MARPISRHVTIYMSGQSAITKKNARMLNCVIWIIQFGSNSANIRSHGMTNHFMKPPGIYNFYIII